MLRTGGVRIYGEFIIVTGTEQTAGEDPSGSILALCVEEDKLDYDYQSTEENQRVVRT